MLTHDISLRTDGNQPIDVLANRHKNLPGHMTALLGPRRLVFNMDTSCTLLDEQLSELHGSCQASMTSISISDNRPEKIRIGSILSLRKGQ